MSPREVCLFIYLLVQNRVRPGDRVPSDAVLSVDEVCLRNAFAELMALAGVRARAQPPWSAISVAARRAIVRFDHVACPHRCTTR